MFGIFEDSKAKASGDDHAMEIAWAVLPWSFKAALSGVHPARDHRNKPIVSDLQGAKAGQTICGGFILVPWSLKGDLRSGLFCQRSLFEAFQKG
jgi:hypothetical protein